MGGGEYKKGIIVRPRDLVRAQLLGQQLIAFHQQQRMLPGIHEFTRRQVLIEQLIESIRRVEYVAAIRGRELSNRRLDPTDEMFDPLKAAILCQRRGNTEEAFWLVFLFVHFGKHSQGGWRYIREIYGKLGKGGRWDWASTRSDTAGFRRWLGSHQDILNRIPCGFGNHRKRESLNAYSSNGTGAVVESYVRWVNCSRTHRNLVDTALQENNGDPRLAFDCLFRSMNDVIRFGRLARFDYLTMLGKLGLASIEPGSTYLQGSSGPVKGARLLFGGKYRPQRLDRWLVELGTELNVGMQVLEDALCNWQKNPDRFVPFRG